MADEPEPPGSAPPPPQPPPSASGSPSPPPPAWGAPPPALGALRGALEAALLRDPGGGPPPELSPLLGVPLPPPAKCRHVDGARLLRDNLRLVAGSPPAGVGGLRTALSILEKYGRNLLQPLPPRHWRAVRYRNPVFRGTVGAIRGGRGVLRLLGYTEETGEGLSFPPGVRTPPGARVAAVTADLLVLRAELDLLLANQHPNPQFFTDILAGGAEEPLEPDALPGHAPPCQPSPPHGEPSTPLPPPAAGQGVGSIGPRPASPGEPAPPPAPPPSPPPPAGGWACASCTFRNLPPRVLCAVCERPRLAPPPAPPPDPPSPPSPPSAPGRGSPLPLPPKPLPPPPKPLPLKTRPLAPPPPTPRQERLRREGQRLVSLMRAAEAQGAPWRWVVEAAAAEGGVAGAGGGGAEGAVLRARGALGAALAALAGAAGRAGAGWGGEGGGAKGGGAAPPPAPPLAPPPPLGALSLREAARAWHRARGRPAPALRLALATRRAQLQVLSALGFGEGAAPRCALYQNGGDVWGALGDLQRRRLQPFLRRHWEPRQPPMDFDCPDQQALVRRALATLGLPSWGRAQLVATLGRELGLGRAPRGVGELVEAVRGCRDPGALRRSLRCQCAVCGGGLPRHQAQWLPGCTCPLCPECFRRHFTLGARERVGAGGGEGALGCPACARPDLRDEGQRLTYFSTLDVQLRQCLDPATYQLLTQKLTELELQRDPQFLWCIQCSFGFIFEGERGPAQCPQCRQRFCPRCQRQWAAPHATLSCEEFGAWLSARDPQVAPVGLAAFLQEQAIGCPSCGARYALARGGCLHCACPRCGHHFCSGCGGPFHQRGSCPERGCPLRGSLHGHHPRDCLFHLRDWDPPRLQRLLQDAGVPFETEPPAGSSPPPGGGCAVLEQKETAAGLRDEPCGREAPPGHAGLCRAHYTEYLVRLANGRGLDPAPLYTAAELRAAAARHLPGGCPPQGAGEGPAAYEERLRQRLQREAPPAAGKGGAGQGPAPPR